MKIETYEIISNNHPDWICLEGPFYVGGEANYVLVRKGGTYPWIYSIERIENHYEHMVKSSDWMEREHERKSRNNFKLSGLCIVACIFNIVCMTVSSLPVLNVIGLVVSGLALGKNIYDRKQFKTYTHKDTHL